MVKKIFSGIYTKAPKKQTDVFLMDSFQIQAESELLPYYLWETIAHDYMLACQHIIPQKESKLLLKKLIEYLYKAENGKLSIDPKLGDVHENIETRLTQEIGPLAGWMHTARSRNDQITTDQKLITKKLFFDLYEEIINLINLFLKKSEQYKNVLMPGFTHLRIAMPSTFGFWWQAYADSLVECAQVLQQIYQIIDKNPLGSGASYGVNWPIDPKLTTKDLGFRRPFANALSAINSRGIHEIYISSSLCTLSIILSRMMEDVIIFNLPEMGYLSIDQGYTHGSSIMPQKVNPDIAEKVRSKSAVLIGNLTSLCAILKGTPSGYNRDSSETKIIIIQSLKESTATIEVVQSMMSTISPNIEKMKSQIALSLSTKLADELSHTFSIPFRQAHEIVGKALLLCHSDFAKLDAQKLEQSVQTVLSKRVKLPHDFLTRVLNPEKVILDLSYEGSPNPKFVSLVNKKLQKVNLNMDLWLRKEKNNFDSAKKQLLINVAHYLEN